MSDSKKPRLSEIVWRNAVSIKSLRNDKGTIGGEGALAISENVQYDIPYLLDLVERMGKALELILVETNPVNVLGPPIITHEMEQKARALLEELKQ